MTKLIISDPKLSIFRTIIKIHFPGKTGGGPPQTETVYYITAPDMPSGTIALANGQIVPYGCACFDANPQGLQPNVSPLTSLIENAGNLGVGGNTPGPYSDNFFSFPPGGLTLNGFICVMQWEVMYGTNGPFFYGGGYYGGPGAKANCEKIINLPQNGGAFGVASFVIQPPP